MSEILQVPTTHTPDDPWGFQLILDCFGCDFDVCCDLERGYEFLDKVCIHLKMTKQTQPYIFKTCETAFPGKPGYSGWVPIIESGIQIHTSARNHFISIDVYSCKKFDQAAVESFVRGWFKPEYVESVLLYRGQGVYQRRMGHRLVASAGD